MNKLHEMLIKLLEVKNMTTLSSSTIYRLMQQDLFPKPVNLTGGRAVAWKLSDIEAWIESRGCSSSSTMEAGDK